MDLMTTINQVREPIMNFLTAYFSKKLSSVFVEVKRINDADSIIEINGIQYLISTYDIYCVRLNIITKRPQFKLVTLRQPITLDGLPTLEEDKMILRRFLQERQLLQAYHKACMKPLPNEIAKTEPIIPTDFLRMEFSFEYDINKIKWYEVYDEWLGYYTKAVIDKLLKTYEQ